MENNIKSFSESKQYEPHFFCHEDEYIKEWLFDVRTKDKFIGIPYNNIKTVVLEADTISIGTEEWYIEVRGKGLRPIYDGIIRNNLVYVGCAKRYEDDKGDKDTFVEDIIAMRV